MSRVDVSSADVDSAGVNSAAVSSANIEIEMAEMVVGWGGNRPAGISLRRWKAIVKFVRNRTV